MLWTSKPVLSSSILLITSILMILVKTIIKIILLIMKLMKVISSAALPTPRDLWTRLQLCLRGQSWPQLYRRGYSKCISGNGGSWKQSNLSCYLTCLHPANVPSDYPLLVHKQSTGKGTWKTRSHRVTCHYSSTVLLHIWPKQIQDHFVTNSVMKTEEDLYLTLRQIPKIWSPLYHTEHL